MLQQQQTLNLSPYGHLYDLLIPKDDELRRIHDEINMSFVYAELVKNYCDDNGRTAEDPIRMFRYLLLKVICDLSDAAVVRRAKTDLLFKYFLDLAPEDTNLIDPSNLCKFRKLRLKDLDLMNLLIGKTISVARSKGLIKNSTIIIDATHTTARAIAYNPVDYLRLRVNRLRKPLSELCEELVASFPVLPAGRNLEQMLECCKTIVELVRKNEIVSSGEKTDDKYLENVVEQSRKNGLDVEEAIADRAYSTLANLELADQNRTDEDGNVILDENGNPKK